MGATAATWGRWIGVVVLPVVLAACSNGAVPSAQDAASGGGSVSSVAATMPVGPAAFEVGAEFDSLVRLVPSGSQGVLWYDTGATAALRNSLSSASPEAPARAVRSELRAALLGSGGGLGDDEILAGLAKGAGIDAAGIDAFLHTTVGAERSPEAEPVTVLHGTFDPDRIEAALRAAPTPGATLTRDTADGMRLLSWTEPDDRARLSVLGQRPGERTTLVVAPNVVVVSTGRAGAEAVIATALGRRPSLGRDPEYVSLLPGLVGLHPSRAALDAYQRGQDSSVPVAWGVAGAGQDVRWTAWFGPATEPYFGKVQANVPVAELQQRIDTAYPSGRTLAKGLFALEKITASERALEVVVKPAKKADYDVYLHVEDVGEALGSVVVRPAR